MHSSHTMSRRRLLTAVAGAAAIAAVPSLASSVGATSTGYRRINANGVRLRTGPGTTYGIIASLASGTHVLFLNDAGSANGYQWVKVRVDSLGRDGYVAAAYLSPISSGGWSAGSMVHVRTAGGGGANLRSGANISAGVVAVVRNGTTGTVLEGPVSNSGYTWYKVSFGNVQGWMATVVLSAGGGSDRSYVRVSSGPLRVRKQPGLSGAIVATMPTGARGFTTTDMPQTADGYTWANVQFDNGVRGWVATSFLTWL